MKTRAVIFLFLFAPLVLSQGSDAEFVVKSAAAERGTLRKTLERKGTFVAADPAALKLDLKVYRGELKLLDVVEHGSFVNKGDVIARIDPKGIDKQIESDALELARAELEMAQHLEQLRMGAEKDAETLRRTERAAERAAKKLRGFREHEKQMTEESERMGIQSRQYRLDDQKDELTELEKMYSEDELVDATEEIVLKRSRRRFAQLQQSFDLSERRRVYRKEWFEAWREEDLETDARKAAKSLERLKDTQAMSRAKAALGTKKKEISLRRSVERFADLRSDKEQFVLRAPDAGLLMHAGAKLEKDGTLRNRAVVCKIGKPQQLKVETDVDEANILKVKTGMAAEVRPAASKDMKLMGALTIDFLPGKGGVFKGEVKLTNVELMLRPGMTCKVKLILGEVRDAVLVPKSAVYKKGDKTVVKVGKASTGPFAEREVVTGLDDGKKIVIADGVAEGEFVVTTPKPAGKKKKTGKKKK